MSEYKPLQELFPLEEGTVLECDGGVQAVWCGNLYWKINTAEVKTPFSRKWRVISTPPKKVEFELPDGHGMRNGEPYISLPDDHPFSYETPLRVTVEEKR